MKKTKKPNPLIVSLFIVLFFTGSFLVLINSSLSRPRYTVTVDSTDFEKIDYIRIGSLIDIQEKSNVSLFDDVKHSIRVSYFIFANGGFVKEQSPIIHFSKESIEANNGVLLIILTGVNVTLSIIKE